MVMMLVISLGAAGLLLPGTAQAVADSAEDAVAKKSKSTADHSKFEELDVNFKNGPEVTKACIECHTEAAKQLHTTKHWKWDYINPDTDQHLGKKHVINNFCTSVPGKMTSLISPQKRRLTAWSATTPLVSTRSYRVWLDIQITTPSSGHPNQAISGHLPT